MHITVYQKQIALGDPKACVFPVSLSLENNCTQTCTKKLEQTHRLSDKKKRIRTDTLNNFLFIITLDVLRVLIVKSVWVPVGINRTAVRDRVQQLS